TSLAPQPLLVSGDRVQLQQVVLNLVMNGMEAIRSAASGTGKVTGRTMLVDGAAEVVLEDSGPGIPPDKAQQIFEPFYTTKDTGMGMGLSIARTIIANHRGRIWAENRYEGGAVFRFTMPLARTERARTAVQTAANQAQSEAPGSRVSGAFHAAQLRIASHDLALGDWRTE